jgi:hypothetical protein
VGSFSGFRDDFDFIFLFKSKVSSSQDGKGLDVKLTASHQLMPMLRMRGAIPPLPHMSLGWDA